jgi:hypothetical protein
MKRCYSLMQTSHGDRRFDIERRRFSYADFIPERRSGKDRRDAVSLFHPSDPIPVGMVKAKWV